jgi:hypothetical protein
MSDTISCTLYGEDLTIENVRPRNGSGAVLDVEHDDGRKWRCEVTGSGKIDEILTTWRDDTLADLDEPDWLEDVLAELQKAA